MQWHLQKIRRLKAEMKAIEEQKRIEAEAKVERDLEAEKAKTEIKKAKKMLPKTPRVNRLDKAKKKKNERTDDSDNISVVGQEENSSASLTDMDSQNSIKSPDVDES